jgi:hypothetical protein
MEEAVSVYLVGALIYGLIISLIEIFFVMQDEGGMHPLVHGLHAVPVAIILTFISMNVPFIMGLSFMGWMPTWAGTILIPIIVGLVATVKVKSAAAIVGGHGSVGEKLPHAIIIGVLIAAAPFVWPLIDPIIPTLIPGFR